MLHSIVRFTEKNSSIIRNHEKSCDRCNAQDIRESFGILTRIGDDVDVFEFANGIWNLCRPCVTVEHQANSHRYSPTIKE